MTLRRWHRLLGLIICLPCLLWGVSGGLLAWKNWARERTPPPAPSAAPAAAPRPFTIPVERALAATGRTDRPSAVLWRHLAGAPHYLVRFSSPPREVLVHGETGAVLPQQPVDEALARSIAEADGPPGARVQAVQRQLTGTLVYPEWNELPVWRLTLDNGDDVYVSPSTGEVRQHADTFFRLVRISFYGLHVWKWSNKPGPATSYLILLGMSALLVFSAATGLFLLLRPRRRPA